MVSIMERVIFREEKNPYLPGIACYLASFPDDPANPGRIGSVAFHFVNDPHYGTDETAIFEPYSEVDYGYYYKTRIIHKRNEIAKKLLNAVECYYKRPFQIVEKIMR